MSRLLLPALWWLLALFACVAANSLRASSGSISSGVRATVSFSYDENLATNPSRRVIISFVVSRGGTLGSSGALSSDWGRVTVYRDGIQVFIADRKGSGHGTSLSGNTTGANSWEYAAADHVWTWSAEVRNGPVGVEGSPGSTTGTVPMLVTPGPPTPVQPVEGTRKKGPTQKVDNPFDFRVKYTYKDAVTGETLAVLNLEPGEVGFAGLIKTGDNDVAVTMTLPDGGVVHGADSEGSPVIYTYPAGTSLSGGTIPDSAFSDLASAPAWSAPTASTVPLPPVAGATMTPNPGGPTTPQIAPSTVKPVHGNAAQIQFSTAGAGTGGATDDTLRESAGAIVKKLGDVEAAIKQYGGSGSEAAVPGSDFTAPDMGEVGTDPASAEAAPVKVPVVDKFVKSDAPSYFSGTIATSSVVTANFEAFGASRTWTFDASAYATPISWFRALLSVIVHYSMFVLITKTGRSAAAGQ